MRRYDDFLNPKCPPDDKWEDFDDSEELDEDESDDIEAL